MKSFQLLLASSFTPNCKPVIQSHDMPKRSLMATVPLHTIAIPLGTIGRQRLFCAMLTPTAIYALRLHWIRQPLRKDGPHEVVRERQNVYFDPLAAKGQPMGARRGERVSSIVARRVWCGYQRWTSKERFPCTVSCTTYCISCILSDERSRIRIVKRE